MVPEHSGVNRKMEHSIQDSLAIDSNLGDINPNKKQKTSYSNGYDQHGTKLEFVAAMHTAHWVVKVCYLVGIPSHTCCILKSWKLG